MSTQEHELAQASGTEAIEKTTEATAGVTAAPALPQHPPRALRRRRAIGIMGGTFDPIHHGHLVAASEVMDVFGLDQVVFVPAAMQPFKAGRRVTAAEHRYLMTVVATASNPRFAVSRVDIDRGGTTYTIDTLADLSEEYPDSDFYFITGADALAQIAQWKDADKLFEQAHFIGVTRPGHNLSDPGLPHESVSLLEVPAMAISSTDCRSRVEEGKPASSNTSTSTDSTGPNTRRTVSLPDATSELATLVARAAHDRGGINPVLVDVTSKLALADAFVVVSAPTDRQVRAIAEDIMDRVWAEHGRRPTHIEGRAEGTWVLLDYSELLVHVLSDEERDYYALERLWGDCPAVSIDVDTEEARAAAAERAAAHGVESEQ